MRVAQAAQPDASMVRMTHTPPAMHPGALLREDVLPALRISTADAAQKLGILVGRLPL